MDYHINKSRKESVIVNDGNTKRREDPQQSRHVRLRILHIGPLPPPVGGMATVIQNLDKALNKLHDVRVLNNVKTTPVGRSFIKGFTSQLRLLMHLTAILIVWRPHLVHIHTCSYFTFWRNAADLLIAKLFRRKVLLHIHGAKFDQFLDAMPAAQARLARMILHLADRIVVLGKAWERVLVDWCLPGTIVIVPNGVPVPEDVISAVGPQSTIICVANYERRKGQADLIRALSLSVDMLPVRVIMFGAETEQGYREELQDIASSLGIAEYVDIRGPVSSETLRSYYSSSKVFCLPSYNEGLPMAMLEAMANCLPVVVTRVGAIPEVVTDGVHGRLYDAGNIDDLAACLQSILTSPQKSQMMGIASRELVVKDYGVDTSARLLCKVYDELTARTI